MNVEKPCGICGGFRAHCNHRNNFILLIGSKFSTTTSNAALLTGSVPSRLRLKFVWRFHFHGRRVRRPVFSFVQERDDLQGFQNFIPHSSKER